MSPGISWAFFISNRLEACFEIDKEMEKGGVTELIPFLLSLPLPGPPGKSIALILYQVRLELWSQFIDSSRATFDKI